MRLGQLEAGVLVERMNRFVAKVRTQRGEELAHLANSGRLTDVLGRGHRLGLRRVESSSSRRTQLDVVLMQNDAGLWVGVDTRLPPSLLLEAVQNGLVTPFGATVRIRREVTWGACRFDLALDDWLVETKSVTLVRDGIGLFPDAPTQRGQRHLRVLREAHESGTPTMVAFVVQRCDAVSLTSHDDIDPAFSLQLRLAHQSGVMIRAFVSHVGLDTLYITGEIPVEI